MSRSRLSLQIDQLQLEGVPLANPAQLAPLVEQELRVLFARQPIQHHAQPLPRLVPSVVLSAQESPQTASRKIAAAIYHSVITRVPQVSGPEATSQADRRKDGRS